MMGLDCIDLQLRLVRKLFLERNEDNDEVNQEGKGVTLSPQQSGGW